MQAQTAQLASAERAFLDRLTGIGKKVETVVVGLIQAAETARARVQGLGAEFDAQAARLLQASQTAQAQAQALRQGEDVCRRDVFLRAASHMIEDLNASAIDLNRILAEDVPEDLWKRYQRGDR